MGDRLGKATGSTGTQNLAKGFLTASVLFCSGVMSVVGSIQAGTTSEMTTILIKSVMDGCMAVVFASVYDIGVMFSFLFILVYQGFFTLAGSWLPAATWRGGDCRTVGRGRSTFTDDRLRTSEDS